MTRSATLEIPPATADALNRAVKTGYVLLTRGGKPVAYVLPAAIYDDEDIGYMTDPEFWKMIEERRRDPRPGIPLDIVEAELEELEREEARTARTHRLRNVKKKKAG